MLLEIIVVLLISIYLLVRRQYSHWATLGIPHVKPQIPFGNLQSLIKKERSFGTAIYDLYKQTSEPFLGIYLFFHPAILVRDAELVKNMLTRDFQHFHDRGIYCEPKSDPMSAHLFGLEGDTWKALRTRLTPSFTSGKLKGMFPIIKNVGDELVNYLKPMAEKGESIDIRDFAGRFVIDCLAAVSFGQEGISTINNPKHEFREAGQKLNDNTNLVEVFRNTARFICPR